MSSHAPFRKVFAGVATREQMFALFDRHRDELGHDPLDGTVYAGEWFEIASGDYHFMLSLLPPLFRRTGMFGLSGYKAAYVTSVFFELRIRGRQRWFHGFCDMSDKRSPEIMRAAIIAHETRAIDSMTHEEKLEAIWNAKHEDYKGFAGDADPDAWPQKDRGKRTIVVIGGGGESVLKLLENLTDEEIDYLLPLALAHGGQRQGGDDGSSA